MSKTVIIIIASVSAVVFLALLITFIRISNKRRFKKLQDNLNKFKQEKASLEQGDKVTIAPDEAVVDSGYDNIINVNETKVDKKGPIIENYVVDEPKPTYYQPNTQPMPRPQRRPIYQPKKLDPEPTKVARASREDDFEDFMNEHSYSRKILDKNLMNKLKNLPPDVKAIILGNVFNKFEDK